MNIKKFPLPTHVRNSLEMANVHNFQQVREPQDIAWGCSSWVEQEQAAPYLGMDQTSEYRSRSLMVCNAELQISGHVNSYTLGGNIMEHTNLQSDSISYTLGKGMGVATVSCFTCPIKKTH